MTITFIKLMRMSVTLLLALSPIFAEASVWTDRAEWDENWEDRYSEWVKENVTSDMFTRIDSPFYGIETDCADFVYITRAIFAEQNALRFTLNTKWKNGERISNRTHMFDNISNTVTKVKVRDDQGRVREVNLPKPLNNGKLRAFLHTMGGLVGTWSLPQDTYPIAIDRQNLRAGTIFLRQGYNRMTAWEAVRTFLTGTPPNPDAGPGHALLVHEVRPSGAIEFIQSTLPKKVRDLSFIYEIELLPTNDRLGFRRFFQPQQVGKSAGRSLPGFSLEQFSQLGREPLQNECNGEIYDPSCFNNDSQKKSDRRNITEFRKDVQKQLATQTESSDEKTERLVKTICGAIRQRADVILTAEPIRQKLGKRCMNARNYDDYSTPSRDEQIRQFIKQISRFDSYTQKLLKECGTVKLDYSNRLYEIDELMSNFGNSNSNPNEAILARWGFEAPNNRCAEPK